MSDLIGGVASIFGAVSAGDAQDDATKAQTATSDAALAQNQQQFNTTQQNLAPSLITAGGALGKLATLYGINTTSGTGVGAFNGNQPANVAAAANQPAIGANFTPSSVTDLFHQYLGREPDAGGLAYFSKLPLAEAQRQIMGSQEYQQRQASGATNPFTTAPSAAGPAATAQPAGAAPGAPNVDPNADFYQSPDYNFRMTQGLKGLTAAGAAKNGTNNGAQQKAEIQYAGDLASGEYGNYKAGLMSLAGLGSGANNTAAAAGQSNANANTGILTQQGNNLASSYLAGGTLAGKAATGVASLFSPSNVSAISNFFGSGGSGNAGSSAWADAGQVF